MKVFKRGMKNIVFGLISQFVILGIGILLPKLFVENYGSGVNGLFSSMSQIFGYVALLEAGLGAATVQALYNPISSDNREEISSVLSATKIYYNRVSFYYLMCVIALSVLYPFVTKIDDIDVGFFGITSPAAIRISIGLVTLLSGLSGVINFYFQATLKQLMIAEGRQYVISNITMIVDVLLSIAKIALVLIGADIVLIQLSYFIIRVLQMVLYTSYYRRHYSWVDFKAKPNFSALRQRNAFLIHQITNLISNSTDVMLLSVFKDFKSASIYAIYNTVISALNTLCSTVNQSLNFILGITYHKDKNRYLRLHDAYNTYFITFIFSIMTVCYMLFEPFIGIYIKDPDIDYNLPYLPLMFCVIQMLSSTRVISNNLISISGHVPQTMIRSAIQAAINLGLSLILIKPLGIYGVLIGTIVSLLYRTTDTLLYTDLKILKRNPIKSYKPVIINFSTFAVAAWINRFIHLDFSGYEKTLEAFGHFLIYGLIYSIIIIPAYFIINSLLAPKSFSFVFDIIKRKLNKRKKSEVN